MIRNLVRIDKENASLGRSFVRALRIVRERYNARLAAVERGENLDPLPPPEVRQRARALSREIGERLRKDQEWRALRESTTLADRLRERALKREAEIRSAALDMLTPEQRQEVRRRDVAALTPPLVPLGPFRWDSRVSDAHNMYAFKVWEAEKQKGQYQ
jgi:hypothetical protein